MKVYSTKYCLTEGIEEIEGKELEPGVFEYKPINSYVIYLHGEGKDWHKTLESAQKRAEEVRIKKLQSLDKQIKKISALKF